MTLVLTFFLLGAADLAFGVYVSFDTEGGAIGMVPMLHHCLIVAILVTMGMALLVFGRFLPCWSAVVAFPATLGVTGWLLSKAGEAGAQHYRKQRDKDESGN